jgi:hypothetical protein
MQRTLERAQESFKAAESAEEHFQKKIAETEAEIVRLQQLHKEQQNSMLAHRERKLLLIKQIREFMPKLEAARAAVPEVSAIQQRIAEIQDTNEKVKANKARKAVEMQVLNLESAVNRETKLVEDAVTAKTKLVQEAKFPVEGLGFSEDIVTFNGIPLQQASTAEQLRVSVAIGLALNPKLKVLLIRGGNALDDESMKLIAKMAEEAGAQVWMEWVTRHAGDNEGISVMIEDGHVA